jgi:hypothetical protein
VSRSRQEVDTQILYCRYRTPRRSARHRE